MYYMYCLYASEGGCYKFGISRVVAIFELQQKSASEVAWRNLLCTFGTISWTSASNYSAGKPKTDYTPGVPASRYLLRQPAFNFRVIVCFITCLQSSARRVSTSFCDSWLSASTELTGREHRAEAYICYRTDWVAVILFRWCWVL